MTLRFVCNALRSSCFLRALLKAFLDKHHFKNSLPKAVFGYQSNLFFFGTITYIRKTGHQFWRANFIIQTNRLCLIVERVIGNHDGLRGHKRIIGGHNIVICTGRCINIYWQGSHRWCWHQCTWRRWIVFSTIPIDFIET